MMRLWEEWTLRSDIRRTTHMYRRISVMLVRWAEESGYVVERRNKAEPGWVLYHRRPVTAGEAAGALLDVSAE